MKLSTLFVNIQESGIKKDEATAKVQFMLFVLKNVHVIHEFILIA